MRGVHVAVLSAAFLLLGSFASTQGIGDAAAREKERRKGTEGGGKVYTEGDLGPSMVLVATPENLPAAYEDDAVEGSDDREAASEEDQRAEAAWRRKLERVRKEEEVYKDMVDFLQLQLNDMTGGIYNYGRASKISFLEENKQLLAEVQERIATLEEEGPVNRYR
jgi:hypothetical protein